MGRKIKIVSVVGARPNFMKIAPFYRAIKKHPEIEHVLVHTGQHYDQSMSKAFFDDLNIPCPDIDLNIGSGSHAEQVGKTMIEFEKVLHAEKPDWVVVVGDVNATCACSITAKKEHVKLAHIEAGLRSNDIDMPEEVNRLVTDCLADLLLTPDRLASQNLLDAGVPADRVVFVGNIMIDTLEEQRGRAAAKKISDIIADNAVDGKRYDVTVEDGGFAVVTLHRPSNVDSPEIMCALVDLFRSRIGKDMRLIWPIHPRTRKNIEQMGLWDTLMSDPAFIMLTPLGYHDMLRLNMGSRLMFTDSGGLQEECCVLGTPCLTMRWNTERPVTLREHGGASILVGNDIARIRSAYESIIETNVAPHRPELWDGNTAERCVKAILAAHGQKI